MADYTPVPTVVDDDNWSAADHNTYIKDNFTYVKDELDTIKATQALATFFTTRKNNSSWDGDSKAPGTYTFLVNDFNADIPNTARAVIIALSAKFDSALTSGEIDIRPKGALGNWLHVRNHRTGYFEDNNGIVPTVSGEISVVINGAGSPEVYIDVLGFFE